MWREDFEARKVYLKLSYQCIKNWTLTKVSLYIVASITVRIVSCLYYCNIKTISNKNNNNIRFVTHFIQQQER